MDYQQLQQQNRELSILNQIAQQLNSEISLEQALQSSLSQAVELLDLRTGWIWLLEPENENATLAAAYQLPPIFQKQPELLEGWCYCIEKYLTGSLEGATNISEITCTRLKGIEQGTEGLRFHASIPLFSNKEKIGILNLVSKDSQKLSDRQLSMLYTIGDMISIAIARARLFEQSKKIGVVEERIRLAREIHDTLAQGLSAISMQIEVAESYLEQDKLEKVQQKLQQLSQLTQDNLEAARRSVLDLRATPLQNASLVEALQTFANEQNIPVIFQQTGVVRQLPVSQEMGLFRIAQEAILNACQHAKATEIHLRIDFTDNKLKLSVSDNGIGFDPDAPHPNFGLIGMNERAKLLNGSLSIQSSPGEGTEVKVVLNDEC